MKTPLIIDQLYLLFATAYARPKSCRSPRYAGPSSASAAIRVIPACIVPRWFMLLLLKEPWFQVCRRLTLPLKKLSSKLGETSEASLKGGFGSPLPRIRYVLCNLLRFTLRPKLPQQVSNVGKKSPRSIILPAILCTVLLFPDP